MRKEANMIFKRKIYSKMLESGSMNQMEEPLDKLSVNLGYLYENIVAQCLTVCGNKLSTSLQTGID